MLAEAAFCKAPYSEGGAHFHGVIKEMTFGSSSPGLRLLPATTELPSATHCVITSGALICLLPPFPLSKSLYPLLLPPSESLVCHCRL